MPQDAQLVAIAELGRVFSTLGWTRRLPALREFYVAVRAGQTATARWSEGHLERMRAVMGLGPRPLPTATHCPRCPPAADGTWNGARTTLHLDDRWACECSRCGSEWVVVL